jgi:hypothetical protein
MKDDNDQVAAELFGEDDTHAPQTGACRAIAKKTNEPCRMSPTADGLCAVHSPAHREKVDAGRKRGGQLTQARKKLAKVHAAALAEAGVTPGALLPSLQSIDTMTQLLADVTEKIANRTYSPQQGAALISALRLGKDFLSLGIEVRLLEEMERMDNIKTIGGR